MGIQESKELSFDTQDFPKEVWVFDADNLDQGTEISHLMMSHAEEYTKDELLVICRKASMVIDQLRTDLAKAQAVPDLGELQERIAGHQYYHDEHGHMIVDMDDVVKEISGFDSWKAQGVPEGFVVVAKELPEKIAEKMAIDRINKPIHENDPVWREIAEELYKNQVKLKKWEFGVITKP